MNVVQEDKIQCFLSNKERTKIYYRQAGMYAHYRCSTNLILLFTTQKWITVDNRFLIISKKVCQFMKAIFR